ncbi:Sugar phosphate isomerase/epimerase [Desulfacinum hydrothermale DSM 13146]|uniref:Sugar phosphate isomerase/epimerase n=1 Tax=Desulfacinum hydrothermale DSM 13146 TaxID=1121390 RepID=A0A1W1XBG7_9BACT|nr:sugar phosphate isomerase/epimerase [Desulfacinum hydrothermale]SMC21018.1 Sugar phosphate isomerase/epimerase [Desulfacinum hydrothermale DSM 13146]
MKVFLSTSFASRDARRGSDLWERLERFPVHGVELDYRLVEPVFRELVGWLKRSRLQVVSLHNFCPIPPPVPPGKTGHDLLDFSAPDREDRIQAVRWAVKTLEHANDLEAPVVIVHGGRVDMDPELGRLYDLLDRTDGPEDPRFRQVLEEKLDERKRKRQPHWDALLWSLDRLAREAERLDVVLGLENRAHYHELPGPDEFPEIFRELDGAPLAYWHDVGHAHLNRLLGLWEGLGPPDALKDQLAGVHVHDARGRDDHLPPGTGELDLQGVVQAVDREVPWVVEVRPKTPDDHVQRGLEYLHGLLATRAR